MRAEIESEMLKLLAARDVGKTICPSEVARQLSRENWRSLMPDVREVAAELQRAGIVSVSQSGRSVDPATVRGPIRIGSALQEPDPRIRKSTTVKSGE